MLDTHHHLWSYNADDYPWIPANTPLAQNQLLAELEEVTSAAGVTGTIAVQARQIIEESSSLLKIADQSDLIRGIVGWLPLVSENVEEDLEHFSDHPKFVGIRHVLQDELDEYFLRNDFHRGLSKLPTHDLRYDILLYQHQIPVATKLVDRQPELGIIIDHIAKPKAQNGRIEAEWRSGMKELAKRENILGVKFSGLATEFSDEDEVDPSTIRAYFEETLEIFGAERVMFGTDWPVCLLRLASYQEWSDTVIGLTSSLSVDEKDLILHKNGETAYQLKS
ncbi:amidohydrolase family protein [Akkermansiaceae bacterium]|nr:amidohydrolase family protein [Akkermansiaceae bacterium]MDB4455565.1 amidohydrolase family protein [Akkermansiaceae bacterium]MDB4482001.1 amidohydrolase family protein [Akkermansiaceae bacterium]MDB4492794.1 amidohydrolase family protein [Akkermansiaceae bacterium]